jgi:hypothetical protein
MPLIMSVVFSAPELALPDFLGSFFGLKLGSLKAIFVSPVLINYEIVLCESEYL